MKLSFFYRFSMLSLAAMTFFTSCTDDGTGEDTLATLTFVAGTNYITGDAEVAPGEVFQVNLTASKGDNDLKVLTIKEEGTNVALDRITLGGSAANANPLLLFGADKTAFDYVIGVQAHTTLEARNYTFEVEDEKGNKVSKVLKITVAGTPVSTRTGVLLNQGGPAGTGGLNLLTGEGTGSTDPNAHIKDEGIDLGLPVASNWKQQISGVNGSEMKYIVKGQNGVAENFSFAGVSIKEELVDLWGKGTAFTVSNVIKVGDLVMVKNGSNYFLLDVKEVNITTNNNGDNYKFDIKN